MSLRVCRPYTGCSTKQSFLLLSCSCWAKTMSDNSLQSVMPSLMFAELGGERKKSSALEIECIKDVPIWAVSVLRMLCARAVDVRSLCAKFLDSLNATLYDCTGVHLDLRSIAWNRWWWTLSNRCCVLVRPAGPFDMPVPPSCAWSSLLAKVAYADRLCSLVWRWQNHGVMLFPKPCNTSFFVRDACL